MGHRSCLLDAKSKVIIKLLNEWLYEAGVLCFGHLGFSSVCLFICPEHTVTQKRTIPKCSNLVQGMTLGTVVLFWGSKVNGQGHRVNKCICHTNILSIAQKRMTQMCSKLI